MQIGVIGLGRMGGNICRRLMKVGHHCVVFDTDAKPRAALAQEGATATGSLAELVGTLGRNTLFLPYVIAAKMRGPQVAPPGPWVR
jgi:6-phosphogluconate dehydrogenase (decarboxylating)